MRARRPAAPRPAARSLTERSDVAWRPRRAAWCCVLLGLLGLVATTTVTGCDGRAESGTPRPVMGPRALTQLRLGETTPADVERLFGVPDERRPDGALVYQHRLAVGTHHEAETVTFRFSAGALSKICRTRS